MPLGGESTSGILAYWRGYVEVFKFAINEFFLISPYILALKIFLYFYKKFLNKKIPSYLYVELN